MTVKNTTFTPVEQNLKDILAVLDETGKPYFITQRNRPKAVIIRYEDFSALVEQAGERLPRIVRRPEISGGEPLIQGTRISVRHIVERVQAGQSTEDVLAALPHLTAAQIYAALSYYYEYQHEIDELIQESQPERVIAILDPKDYPERHRRIEKAADGVAVVRSDAERSACCPG